MCYQETLEFDVPTVDSCGEVIRRCHHTANRFVDILPGDVPLAMIKVPGGAFQMGTGPGQGFDDESPEHVVHVPAFFLGQYPLTQAQWQAVMGSLPPCRGQGAQRPVDRVSWNDADAFCRRLADQTGRAYRLPSETEWEYACRAGTTTPFAFGDTLTTELANYVGEHTYRLEPKGIYRHTTTDVGSFPPNAFGLFDMHGNLLEWCADAWHDTYAGAPADGSAWPRQRAVYRVMRGGCWHDPPNLCRSATRLKFKATEGEDYCGFRVALTCPES